MKGNGEEREEGDEIKNGDELMEEEEKEAEEEMYMKERGDGRSGGKQGRRVERIR